MDKVAIARIEARFLRQKLGIDGDEKIDVLNALENAKKLGLLASLILVEDQWLPDDDATWDPVENSIIMRRQVFEDAKDGDARARFTIAHELAHCCLKHRFSRNRRVEGVPEFGRQRAEDEVCANEFAAEFLAPIHKLTKAPRDTKALMARFGLSEQTARSRIRTTSAHLESTHRESHSHDPLVEEDSYQVYMRSVLRSAVVFPDL